MYKGKIEPGMWFVRKVFDGVDVTTNKHKAIFKEENIKIVKIDDFKDYGYEKVAEITTEKLFRSFEDINQLKKQIIRKMTKAEIAIMNV